MTVMTRSSHVMARRPSANIPQFCSTQDNWMSYHGTQSAVVKLSEVDDNSVKRGNKIYDNRRQWYQDMKCRLYAIKLQNDLIPAKIDEEPSKNSSDDTVDIVEDGLQEDPAVTEMKRLEEEEYQQLEAAMSNEEDTQVLQRVERGTEEMREALNTLAAVVRRGLICMGAAYTSYLDGSQHTSLSKLDAYNAQHASVAEDPTFSTDQLRRAMEQYDAARRELEQHRMQHAGSSVSHDGDNDAEPEQAEDADVAQSPSGQDEEEQVLLHKAQQARDFLNQSRLQYNERAMTNVQ